MRSNSIPGWRTGTWAGVGLDPGGGRRGIAVRLAGSRARGGAGTEPGAPAELPGQGASAGRRDPGLGRGGSGTRAARERTCREGVASRAAARSADPTPWLYLALLRQEQNRINEAIRALEESVARNENRRVFRSRLLLDEDRAVRGANLASLYRDAGMREVAVREAGRAVDADYANASAHLFLAHSYNALRDPRQADLRYETAWFGEFLMGTCSRRSAPARCPRCFPRTSTGPCWNAGSRWGSLPPPST